MIRKLCLILSICLPSGLMALGMGDINIKSGLNQPLNATIPLVEQGTIPLSGINVSLASIDEFHAAKVNRNDPNLSLLRFEVLHSANGNAYVHVYTLTPIDDPMLDFLLKLNWPNGNLLHEYTVFLDPVTGSNQMLVQTPAPKPAVKSLENTATSQVNLSTIIKPSGQVFGPVTPRDRLWSVARQTAGSGVSLAQQAVAILTLNPNAFVQQNINGLKSGAKLNLPTSHSASQIPQAQAELLVGTQTQAWLGKGNAVGTDNMPAADDELHEDDSDISQADDNDTSTETAAAPENETARPLNGPDNIRVLTNADITPKAADTVPMALTEQAAVNQAPAAGAILAPTSAMVAKVLVVPPAPTNVAKVPLAPSATAKAEISSLEEKLKAKDAQILMLERTLEQMQTTEAKADADLTKRVMHQGGSQAVTVVQDKGVPWVLLIILSVIAVGSLFGGAWWQRKRWSQALMSAEGETAAKAASSSATSAPTELPEQVSQSVSPEGETAAEPSITPAVITQVEAASPTEVQTISPESASTTAIKEYGNNPWQRSAQNASFEQILAQSEMLYTTGQYALAEGLLMALLHSYPTREPLLKLFAAVLVAEHKTPELVAYAAQFPGLLPFVPAHSEEVVEAALPQPAQEPEPEQPIEQSVPVSPKPEAPVAIPEPVQEPTDALVIDWSPTKVEDIIVKEAPKAPAVSSSEYTIEWEGNKTSVQIEPSKAKTAVKAPVSKHSPDTPSTQTSEKSVKPVSDSESIASPNTEAKEPTLSSESVESAFLREQTEEPVIMPEVEAGAGADASQDLLALADMYLSMGEYAEAELNIREVLAKGSPEAKARAEILLQQLKDKQG